MREEEYNNYINNSPKLQSILYDMDLLPEQCPVDSIDLARMRLIANLWKNLDYE